MKRSILSAVFAVILVFTVAFLIAPKANAASITLKDGETLNITADTVLDLAGNSGSVHVAEGVKLSVIDSGNKSITGANAGKLTVLSGEVEAEAEDATGKRFLKLQNADGTFSFHPFYVTIKQIGINTNKGTLCLQAMFVTNEIAQKAVSTGIVYGEEELTETAPTNGAFAFKDGVMYAYYDLMGSFADQTAMEKVKSFRACITVGKTSVYSKTIATISPLETLNTVCERFATFSDYQQSTMLKMIESNPQLQELPAVASMIHYAKLPKMEVTKTENPNINVNVDTNFDGIFEAAPLSVQYTFVAKGGGETYRNWIADFYVSVDLPENVENEVAATGVPVVLSIAGQYDINGPDWMPITLPIPQDVADVPLLQFVTDYTFTYSDIQRLVSVFNCGVVGDEVGGADEGIKLTVEFRIIETREDENTGGYVPVENGEKEVLGVFEYIYK